MTEYSINDDLPPPTDAEQEEEQDLGFGSVVAGQSRPRLVNPDGSFNVERTGLSIFTSLNPYHALLAMSWGTFLGLVLLLYFLSNVLFGSLYAALGPEALVDTTTPTSDLFVRGFFFSVQTFATIGYGTIHPIGVTPNLLVTVESYYSLLANALITGAVFARFARPTAKIVFSDVAVVAPYRGMTGFMFRIVNGRTNQLIELCKRERSGRPPLRHTRARTSEGDVLSLVVDGGASDRRRVADAWTDRTGYGSD